MSCLIGSRFGFGNNALERSVYEIRRCAPVLLYKDNLYTLVFASELLEESSFSTFTTFSEKVYLLLTASRMGFISDDAASSRIHANNLSLGDIRNLLTSSSDNTPDLRGARSSTSPLDTLAIDIVKMAKLLPSALVIDCDFANDSEMSQWCTENNILCLNGNLITEHQANYSLDEVCSSSLYLEDSIKSKILVYRSNAGEPEHYAIVIGDPDTDDITVRIHSSCYTGDLLGSLSCDCRGQLLAAVRLLASDGKGGVILYISQEGRGIGLANKIRAYNLQTRSMFDTVDANRFLGFDDDERIFLPAAMILKNLGISRLRLLTCNPRKVSGLESHGFEVTERIAFSVGMNKYNGNYLKAKRQRLGHLN